MFNAGVRELCRKLNEYNGRKFNEVRSVDMFGDILNYKVKDFSFTPLVETIRKWTLLSSSLAGPNLTLSELRIQFDLWFHRSSSLASWQENSGSRLALE